MTAAYFHDESTNPQKENMFILKVKAMNYLHFSYLHI